jgi:hypothetical protein
MNDKTNKTVTEIEQDLADASTPLAESEVAAGVMAGAVIGSLGGIPGAVVGAVVGGAAAVVDVVAHAHHAHQKKENAEGDAEKHDDEVDMDDRPTPTTPGSEK